MSTEWEFWGIGRVSGVKWLPNRDFVSSLIGVWVKFSVHFFLVGVLFTLVCSVV